VRVAAVQGDGEGEGGHYVDKHPLEGFWVGQGESKARGVKAIGVKA
jgi:hypothetical protein